MQSSRKIAKLQRRMFRNHLRENVNFILRPKPRYIPRKIWVWIIDQVVRVEILEGGDQK
jgi:hypothetical protein